MKITTTLLLTVFLTLFSSAIYAQNNVKNLLMTSATQQIRQAARIMTSGEQNTLENSRLLASIIEKEFESAPSSRIDALSWGCRALAATGDTRYKPLLKKIYQSNLTHRKLKKYAKRAYQDLAAIALNTSQDTPINASINKESMNVPLSLNLPINKTQGLIPKASLTTNERKIFAIAKGDWQVIKFISQQLVTLDTPDMKILDALSQFLVEKHTYNLTNEQIDVLAWICRALEQSKSTRYKPTLETVITKITNQKLHNYATAANNKLMKTAAPYVSGNINFSKIIDEFRQN